MLKKFLNSLCAMALALNVLTLFSCAGGAMGGGDLEETGLSVRLPTTRSAQWNISDVEIFTVTIKSSSYKDTKTASQGETITFSNIPVGHYYIEALGKKSSGEVTAKGTAEVDVVADQTSSAEVHMGRLNYCTVTFDRNVIEPVPAQTASQNVTEGYTAIKPANPTATGKTFSYWSISDSSPTPYDFSTPVTSDITLYAIWNEVTYNITFNYNGGTDGSGNTSCVVPTVHDQSPTQPTVTLTRPGYTLSGGYWSDTPGGYQVNVMPATEDATYYAMWEPTQYEITYSTPVGDTPNADNYTIVTSQALPTTLNYEGLTFAGWYDNSTFAGEAITSVPVGSTGNKTFYAKWTATVEFYPDDSLFPSISTETVVYNQCIPLLPNPTQGDQAFLGWYCDDGDGDPLNDEEVTSTTPITRDMQIYAKWGLGGMP